MLLGRVWRDPSITDLSVEPVSQGRNADHWRVRRGDETFVLRVTDRPAQAERVIAALTALESQGFAPRLHGSYRTEAGRYLIAMEEMPGSVPGPLEIQERQQECIDIIRHLHAHPAFRRAVQEVGDYGVAEDTPPRWVEGNWRRLQQIAPSDERVQRAGEWLDRARRVPSMKDLLNSVMVCGHGDLHRDNWRLTAQGPVLIDWEDIGQSPLALELGSLINFAHLDPVEVAERYGAPQGYAVAIEHAAVHGALYLYLYWLCRTIEGSDPQPDDLAYAESVCERYFG